MMKSCLCAWTLVCAIGNVALADLAFQVLPSISGNERVLARGISGNGQVIAGSGADFTNEHPFVWRQISGTWTRFGLPGEGAQLTGRPVALSFDGDAIAGMSNRYLTGSASSGTPAIWRGVLSGTPTITSPLDDPPTGPRRGLFSGISADGTRVVGHASVLTLPEQPEDYFLGSGGGAPTVISPAGGYRGALLTGNCMSADGRSAAGNAGANTRRAVKWTESGGWVDLPAPTTGSFRNAYAESISADGNVLGGFLASTNGSYNMDGRPCIWNGTGVNSRTDLPLLTGLGTNGRVSSLSADGSVAVGVQHSGILPLDPTVSSWSSLTGVVWINGSVFNLGPLLSGSGVDLQGVTPRWITGVSADGRTVVGIGTSSTDGTAVSFVATIPAPAAAPTIVLAALCIARPLRSATKSPRQG